MQLNHYNSKFTKKTFPITVVCDHVTNAPNIGSLFRVSDAFGITQLIFCGESITIGRKVSKTSRATEKSIGYRINQNIDSVISTLKSNNYYLIGIEITASSQPIHNFDFKSIHKPIALIVGDENFGISDAILKQLDVILHIEMFGANSSMNVVMATNVALYEITKQLTN